MIALPETRVSRGCNLPQAYRQPFAAAKLTFSRHRLAFVSLLVFA